MAFHSLEEIQKSCREKNVLFWRAVLLEDMADRSVTETESMQSMQQMWTAMKSASEQYDRTQVSASGLVGKMGAQMEEYRQSKEPLCGPFVSKVIARALEMGESNACMKRIVAAPTAGSSGVIPGTLCALQEQYGFTDDEICQALFNAAAIGYLITRNATTAGAEGGCQAEVGSASAMAASAAVELFGGTPRQCMDAASFAMVNILGLVCDPIGGLVENPCQNRNAMGASNALISAELSLAGVKSITPIDETIGVMYAVGRSIPSELRETSLGGMAVAKSACENCMACANKRNKMKK